MKNLNPDNFESLDLPFKVNRLSPNIGAELLDIDLSHDLDEETYKNIYQALLVYKVIFFRKQDLSTEEHLKFAKHFGELEVHPFAPHKNGFPEVLCITHNEKNKGRENTWHSDVTWREIPSLGSILRMIEGPKVGGDTLFSDMHLAYEGLPDEFKERLEGAIAVHDFAGFRKRLEQDGKTPSEIEALNKKFPCPEHPVIRTHPDTKQKVIYVNKAFTKFIKGWDKDESSAMLDFLYSQAAIPEYQCRFVWEKDSIAFWDNRACQHYAVSDYWPQVRRVERVTVIGDRPY
tara:strand:+ start:1108 stop:1974 length:867 start_codon:yes stop_codon:yes gene_type:complete